MTTRNRTGLTKGGPRRWSQRGPSASILAVLAATSGIGAIGAGLGLVSGLGTPVAAAATLPRPLVRGTIASLGTNTLTLTSGVATLTVDVSPTTTYTDAAVSAASFATLAVGMRVALQGTSAGTNLVDASAVRILQPRPPARLPARVGVARLAGGTASVRGATAFVPLSCAGAVCRGTLRLSIEEILTTRRGRSFVHRDVLVLAAAGAYSLPAGSHHLVALRLSPHAFATLARARGRRMLATATILSAGRAPIAEHLQLVA